MFCNKALLYNVQYATLVGYINMAPIRSIVICLWKTVDLFWTENLEFDIFSIVNQTVSRGSSLVVNLLHIKNRYLRGHKIGCHYQSVNA